MDWHPSQGTLAINLEVDSNTFPVTTVRPQSCRSHVLQLVDLPASGSVVSRDNDSITVQGAGQYLFKC